MSNQNRKYSERVEALERQFQAVPAIIGDLNKLATRLNNISEVLETTIEVLADKKLITTDELEAAIKAKAAKKREAKAEEEAEQVRKMVEASLLETVETVDGDMTLVVAAEYLADGAKVPGLVRAYAVNLKPEVREALKGKAVGDVVDVGEGRKLEVLELYRVRSQPQTPPPEPVATNVPAAETP